MPGLIPAPSTSIRRGASGIAAWAVQRALNDAHVSPALALDSDFGRKTESNVRAFQARVGLREDAVFGLATSGAMAAELRRRAEQDIDLPPRLLEAIITRESSDWILAQNARVAGGVDCGYCQRRVYAADYWDAEVVRRAFSSLYQIKLLASTTRTRRDAFYGAPAVAPRGDRNERAWRLAVLHHNYQYAAQELAAGRWPSSYAKSPQDWVVAIYAPPDRLPVTFPDGAPIQTPMEHCQRYALGSAEHGEPGQMVRLVEDWSA